MEYASVLEPLDQHIQFLLKAMTPQVRQRKMLAIGRALRKANQKRIQKQVNADGSAYVPKKGRRRMGSPAARAMVAKDIVENRYGFSYGSPDYHRLFNFLIQHFNQRDPNKVRRSVKMFRALRKNKRMKLFANADRVSVGFKGRDAKIARIHQFGLRDKINASGQSYDFPVRELLGISREDINIITEIILDDGI